jgi:SAM-dependent methyltransferase
VDGKLTGSSSLETRDDNAKHYPGIAHAAQSNFACKVATPVGDTSRVSRVDVVGYYTGQSQPAKPTFLRTLASRFSRPRTQRGSGAPVARMSAFIRLADDDKTPLPPTHLRYRVTHNEDPDLFRMNSLKALGEFLEPLSRHARLDSCKRILDWGCGCGRLARHFVSLPHSPAVTGCDIDPEAIAWCQENLSGASFVRVDPFPPTPFPAGAFDLVTGASVFTHLSREIQFDWLEEMRRIIARGGFLLATTHGDSAALFASPHMGRRTAALGFLDEIQDPTLDGIAPNGYYRATFQSREYTLREWSKYFEIVEYVEQGLFNYQDLVIMRRPA